MNSIEIDRRFFWPPESFSTRLFFTGVRPKISMTSSTRALRCAAETSCGSLSFAASKSV